VFHWNTDSDAANIPDVGPQGDPLSVMPMPLTWYCVELTINTNGHLAVSIDGKDIPGLAEDGTPTDRTDMAWIGQRRGLTVAVLGARRLQLSAGRPTARAA